MTRAAVLLTLALAVSAAGPASAECSTLGMAGTKCITAAPRVSYKAGDPLPDGAELVLNPRYYGLPAVDGAWRYYRVGHSVYRVDSRTLTLIERVDGVNPRLFW
jgi:hypothetical protein